MIDIVFCGTTNFSAEILKELINNNLKPAMVITQPDRAKDRKNNYIYSPVKLIALKYNIPLKQPEKIISLKQELLNHKNSMMIVVAFAQIIPDEILNIFKYKCWNIHASDLPNFRGGAPIQYAIMNNSHSTGITIIKMINKLDAGPILLKESIQINNQTTYKSLVPQLIEISKKLILKTIELINKNNYQLIEQDHTLATYSPNIKKELEYINWNQDSYSICCHIRAFNDDPVAKTNFNKNTIIKIYDAQPIKIDENIQPGKIINISKNGILVSSKSKTAVNITELQWPGKKKVLVKDWINGQKKIKINDFFY